MTVLLWHLENDFWSTRAVRPIASGGEALRQPELVCAPLDPRGRPCASHQGIQQALPAAEELTEQLNDEVQAVGYRGGRGGGLQSGHHREVAPKAEPPGVNRSSPVRQGRRAHWGPR